MGEIEHVVQIVETLGDAAETRADWQQVLLAPLDAVQTQYLVTNGETQMQYHAATRMWAEPLVR